MAPDPEEFEGLDTAREVEVPAEDPAIAGRLEELTEEIADKIDIPDEERAAA